SLVQAQQGADKSGYLSRCPIFLPCKHLRVFKALIYILFQPAFRARRTLKTWDFPKNLPFIITRKRQITLFMLYWC
ncbi:MAG: hypothetical protein II957_07355, partial [Treponema sp.]|nr:hypothetical protein [Treponema sp.]